MDKQTKGLNRNVIDKFYTKSDIAKICMDLFVKYIDITKNDLIIEPSAGNGVFIPFIKEITDNYKFCDLEPDNKEIEKCDFLKIDYETLKKNNKVIHIIGNPPFGRQSSMAIKFIKTCCKFANSISFILPKSFKKDSLRKHFKDNFHLICEVDLPKKSFLVNNVEYDVPCVFQIWQYKKHIREKKEKQVAKKFKFVKKTDKPDISFRRVGVNAGTVSKEINNKSKQSHYFINFTNNKTINENIETLNKISFDFNNTVGPKSISKQELIIEFNKLLI